MLLIRILDVASFLSAAVVFVWGVSMANPEIMGSGLAILVGGQFLVVILKSALGYEGTATEELFSAFIRGSYWWW